MLKIAKLILIFCLGVFFAACASEADRITTQDELSESLKDLQAVCPSNLLPKRTVEFDDLTGLCEANEEHCIKKCSNGDPNICFGLANIYNSDGKNKEISQILYKQSCKLGLPSGCTNAGSGLLDIDELDNGECLLDTFKGTCSMGDPWGCTMQAWLQSDIRYIDVVERDFEAALEALEGSCLFGVEDPACSNAKSIEAGIKEAMAE